MKTQRYAPLALNGFEPLFQRFFGNSAPFSRADYRAAGHEPSWIFADLFEDEGNFFVCLEMPGVKREKVKVEVDGDQLNISFQRTVRAADKAERNLEFERQLSLPEGSDDANVSAALRDGILTVTIPKAEERRPKSIEVN